MTLSELRIHKYGKTSALNRHIENLETLGPNSDGAHQHIQRVHYQIREWKGDKKLDAVD